MDQTKRRVLVINRSNNMGDAMCQMRGLKEYKDMHPEMSFDFVTCFYLHYVMANHTDIFDNIIFNPDLPNQTSFEGYDETIEFKIDWGQAVMIGILKAWTKETLHFIPSTDKPYFLLTPEEKLTSEINLRQIMYNNYVGANNYIDPNTGNLIQNSPRYRKSVIVQPESVSDPRRGFQPQDWERFFNLFPDDVAIIYLAPISRHYEAQANGPVCTRPNFIMLPGYPVGHTAAMMEHVDCIFTVHSGSVMLAHAVNAKNIVHINFLEMSGEHILKIPPETGENILFQSNMTIDWSILEKLVVKYLS